MKTFRQAAAVFLIFLIGTLALVHVDRQCAMMEAQTDTGLGQAMEKLEKLIEK